MKKISVPLQQWSKQFTSAQVSKAKTENNYYEVVKVFKETRRKLGLTQQQLADIAGIDRTVITKIETGARNTTISSLQLLAEAMDKKLKISFV